MKKIYQISIMFFVLFSSSVFAERNFDGHLAFGMCTSQQIEMSAGCSMFIVGAAETLRMVGYSEKEYCLPDDMNNNYLRQTFLNYLSNNQDLLQYSASSLFYGSLVTAFPCEKADN